ncbi:Tas retrotransposon peptidase A16, partial [Ancylostoma caninum]
LIKERELADSILLEQERTSTHFNTIKHTNHHRRGISPQDQIYSSPLEHLAYHSNHSPSPPLSVDLASVQLRKVELPTFDGDFAMYYDFWAKFKAAVHDNPNLTTAAKFIHLANSLKGSAALVVQGYDITDPANYHLAVEALRRRYDRPQFTHHFFLQKLENLPVSSASASAQRDTLCQVQACILQLNRFEDTSTSLALKKLIRNKFPRETQLEVNRMEHRSGRIWKMSEFLVGLDEFIQELEKLDDSQFPSEPIEPALNTISPFNRTRSPSPESFDPHRCCFCGSRNHRPTRCTTSMRPYVRRMVVRNFNLCWMCLHPGHTANTCQYPTCPLCGGKHHEVLCNHYMDSRPTNLPPRHRGELRRHDGRNTYRQPRERFPSRDSSRDSVTSSRPYSPYRRDRNYPYHSLRGNHSPSPFRSPYRSDRNYTHHSPRRSYSPSPFRRISRDRYYHQSPRREYSPYRDYRRAVDRTYDHGSRYRTPSNSPSRSVRFRNTPRDSLSPIRRRYHSNRNTIPQHHNTFDDTDEDRFNAYLSDDSFTLTSFPEHHRSLLMTVKGHIRNEETGTLQPVNIMLDSGAQTSFITKDAASRLSLEPQDTKPLTVVGFGGHRSSEESGIVTTNLIDKTNKPLPVKLRTREVLTKSFKPYHLSKEDRHTLRSYRIDPDSLSARSHVTPDILLGIDYFWEVLKKDIPKQLPSGLMLVQTRFGPVVSGSTFFR